MLRQDENRLVFSHDGEQLWIEPWGPDAFRVRATKDARMPSEAWALDEQVPSSQAEIKIPSSGSNGANATTPKENATIRNGKLTCSVSSRGKLVFSDQNGKTLLQEYTRNRRDLLDAKCSALEVEAREFKPQRGGDYHLTARFESLDPAEQIFGMGQYQQPFLDLKGLDLELAQRNSQASVPFAVSSRGYGLLWNQPAVGRAVFGKNITSFEAYATSTLDYWIVAGDTPRDICRRYSDVTGKVPMMPEYGLGFWQCKLRYETQDELLEVAREYRRREIPLDLIVIDFFHWTLQGEWKFDPKYWPDVDAMMRELKALNIEVMVSIWPTVDNRSENFQEMLEKGLLVRTERGLRTNFDFEGQTVYYDPTNPEARKYIWSKARQNYYNKGIRCFWLDEAEPEYSVYDFDNYRYALGPCLRVGNWYPRVHAQAFYEGMEQEGQSNIINLLRCAWAGSQKYGALVWSGDIASSWSSFADQLAAGLNMGMAGIPWWTTDIGGFHGGNPKDEAFRELFVRWFQWGTFCPVMRLHGDREPKRREGLSSGSGADNEVWSYGEEVYGICKRYIDIREQLRNYTRDLMAQAHKTGDPIMRPLFYDFPHDSDAWRVGTSAYMYGDALLCCPVMEPGKRELEVYLPVLDKDDSWVSFYEPESANVWNGGQRVVVPCGKEEMPVFVRKSRIRAVQAGGKAS
ncbi:glycosyl hydrolases family 31-domain-containing protein [Emericellopsis atlantica]|uniref:Glycosyl hydrolases family 31-domain-containing protein n=1 Tax=Emericellopsis atlantica TaxID=2614577 RepID=A0A9P7ZVY0_9HYPO|nr:glycosyl hydrolases family 31-domain-containing protein [Emericellopsis atlantica]KAG9258832.1 glycosyl hydrolases family 31-domain-containing protein [Emericellopsis atlantica]